MKYANVSTAVDVEHSKEKASTMVLPRCIKIYLLLIVIEVMILKQDFGMISKYLDTAVRIDEPVNDHNTSASTSKIFLLPSSEWLEDIDTDSYVLGCGNYKCAFHSRTSLRDSNSNNDPDRDRYGYLVSIRIDLDIAERSFALAQKLSETFSIKHTLIANPLNVSIGKTYRRDHSFVVQPIHLYPKDSINFRCVHFENKKNFESLRSFQYHSVFVNPKVYEERLRSDVNKTMEMMMDSNHSQCLSKDFQVAIDTITGSIVHIDIDRCFQENIGPLKPDTISKCMLMLENISKDIISRKKYLYTKNNTRYNRQNFHHGTYNMTAERPTRERMNKKRIIGMINMGLGIK